MINKYFSEVPLAGNRVSYTFMKRIVLHLIVA